MSSHLFLNMLLGELWIYLFWETVLHISLGEKETVYFLNSVVFQQIFIFKEQYLESRTQDALHFNMNYGMLIKNMLKIEKWQ